MTIKEFRAKYYGFQSFAINDNGSVVYKSFRYPQAKKDDEILEEYDNREIAFMMPKIHIANQGTTAYTYLEILVKGE